MLLCLKNTPVHFFPTFPSTPFRIHLHSPVMSSRFWQSLLLGSGRHHIEGDNECETEVDTSARLGVIRVRAWGRGGGRYGCKIEVMTSGRWWWMQVCVRRRVEGGDNEQRSNYTKSSYTMMSLLFAASGLSLS